MQSFANLVFGLMAAAPAFLFFGAWFSQFRSSRQPVMVTDETHDTSIELVPYPGCECPSCIAVSGPTALHRVERSAGS